MKIDSIAASALALGMIAIASPAIAQQTDQAAVGADAAFMLPVGDFADITGPLLGALLHFEYPVMPGVVVTARTGYLYGLKKEQGLGKFGVSDIPIWAGGKYYFSGQMNGLYGGLELGLNILSFRSEVDMGSFGGLGGGKIEGSESETKFGANLGLGYRVDALDFRGSFNMLDLGHAGDTMGIMASVGYSFARF